MNVCDRDFFRAGFALASASPSQYPATVRALRKAEIASRFASSDGGQKAISEFFAASRALATVPHARPE